MAGVMTAARRTLTDEDVDAIAKRLAELLAERDASVPERAPRPTRTKRVASAKAHELIAAKNRRYAGGSR